MNVKNIIGQELQVLDKNIHETITESLECIDKPDVLNEIIEELQDLVNE
jgi:hypothetical protein